MDCDSQISTEQILIDMIVREDCNRTGQSTNRYVVREDCNRTGQSTNIYGSQRRL